MHEYHNSHGWQGSATLVLLGNLNAETFLSPLQYDINKHCPDDNQLLLIIASYVRYAPHWLTEENWT